MAAKLKEIRQKLRERMHASVGDTVKWLQSVVRGYYQYHAVPGNQARMKAFRHDVLHMWLQLLRRRSQRSRWTWRDSKNVWGISFPWSRSYIRTPMCDLPPPIQGRNRVR